MRWEGNVRQMVVPDRVVKNERAVAVAPGVTRFAVLLDDDERHAELLQPGAEHDAALAAADDQAIRLPGDAEFGILDGAELGPCLPVAVCAVANTHLTGRPNRLLMPLQRLQRRKDGAALA